MADQDRTALIEPLNDTYLSGRPYYCNACGLGYGEYLVCEDGGCELETVREAQERLARCRAALRAQASPEGRS